MQQQPIKNIDTPKAELTGESDGAKTTLQGLIDTVENVYRDLLKGGYKLNEIEEMDLFYFLYLIDEENKEPEFIPIDKLNW